MSRLLLRTLSLTGAVIGLLLLVINLYGLTQSIRMPGLGIEEKELLRFVPEDVWSYEQSLAAISSLNDSNGVDELAENANEVVNKSLVHIEWKKVDPKKYRQLVPVWENFLLYGIGVFSGLEQFERYHYSDYKRNIKRGIGVCGDASTVLSSILDEHNIENRIVSFQGHVIVEYLSEDGSYQLLDPDFGVSLKVDLDNLKKSPFDIKSRYIKKGYTTKEVDALMRLYLFRDYKLFDGTYEFMKKRYVFEKVSYFLKWLVPLILIFGSLLIHVKIRTKRGDSDA